jgi:hypothetical protein
MGRVSDKRPHSVKFWRWGTCPPSIAKSSARRVPYCPITRGTTRLAQAIPLNWQAKMMAQSLPVSSMSDKGAVTVQLCGA